MSKSNPQFIEDQLFTEIVGLLPIVTTDLVIFNENKQQILLFKRTNKPAQNLYFTPGGRLFKNEDLLAGIIRQSKREIGLDLDPNKLTFGGVINEIWSDSEFANYNYHAVSIFWSYVISSQEIINLALDRQHSVYQWFNIDDENLHKYIQERLVILGLISRAC
jgi:colanic acid biosynthesis protein WcaH